MTTEGKEVSPVVGQVDQSVAETKDSVSYDTHRRLLAEKKALQEKLEAYNKAEQERADADAKKRGDYEALLKARETELQAEKSRREQLEGRIVNGMKLNAVMDALGGKVEQKWLRLIDVSDVAIHPETGDVDQMSVTAKVEALKREWPEMIATPRQPLPAKAPLGNGLGTINRDEWLKLPAKDMRKYKPDQIIG